MTRTAWLAALTAIILGPVRGQEPPGAQMTEDQARARIEKSQELYGKGRHREAVTGFQQVAEALPETAPGREAAYWTACCHALLGQRKQAIDWLERAVQHGWKELDTLENDPDLESLREDPRLKALAAKLKRGAGKPEGAEAADRLRINGREFLIFAAPGEEAGENEREAFRIVPQDMPGEGFVIYRKGRGISRLGLPDRRTMAVASPGIAGGSVAWSVADLFWQAVLSEEWKRHGDRILQSGEIPPEDVIDGLTAYERASRPPWLRPALVPKMSELYLGFLKDPRTPAPVLRHICASVISMPGEIQGSAPQKEAHALARACALYVARCYPRAAQELGRAGSGEEAAGLRAVFGTLGIGAFESAGSFETGGWSVTAWKGLRSPEGPSLPRYERCLLAESEGRLRTFLLSSQTIHDKPAYLLHEGRVGGETLLEAYGAQCPPAEELQRRVAAALGEARRAAPPPEPSAAGLPAPAGEVEPASLEVQWSGEGDGGTVEFRLGGLEAALWRGPGVPSPILFKSMPPGTYAVTVRDADGRVSRRGRLTLTASEKTDLDLDGF